MHARVTTIRGRLSKQSRGFRPSATTPSRQSWRLEVRAEYCSSTASPGNALAITLWADEAAMRASEERANELRRVASEQLGAAGPPSVHRYEVAVFEKS